ncbi:hypothetical protein EUAN_22130 [Andreesenia angusta]|uniref:Uncharacterized protein n=1 Tax=Andreesenia angusta TaxID=39480 RepID=A0A1S1V3Y2_9FIRM|nr:hypothetical protein [Andreesenia angusta]OHW61363.1 hypothetical protein EUAN_22130 [Andreesenia angusta]
MEDTRKPLKNSGIKDVLESILNDSKMYDEKNILLKLEKFYNYKQKHYYHEIAEFIFNNSEYLSEENSVDSVINKIGKIVSEDTYFDNKSLELFKKIEKLYDHLRLERVRLNKVKEENDILKRAIGESFSLVTRNLEEGLELDKKIEEIKNDIERFNRDLNENEKRLDDFENIKTDFKNIEVNMGIFKENLNKNELKLKDSENRLNEFNTQSITVLSIFAGIVMAFFGGMSFLSEVFKSIDSVSKYRLIFMTFMVGFVMFNTIFLLLVLIAKIIGKDIRSLSVCKDENCICDERCGQVKRFIRKHPISFYPNAIMVTIIVMTSLFWIIEKIDVLVIRDLGGALNTIQNYIL